MLHEVLAGVGRGLGRTAAKAMSSDYYYAEKKSLEFYISNYRNCQTYVRL